MLSLASLLYPAVAVTTAAVGAVTYVWYQRPVIAVRLMIRLGIRQAGLTVKYKEVQGIKHCYMERGSVDPNRPSLILLHGFTSSKDNYVSVMKYLPSDVHVVAVDFVGHGDSSLPPDGVKPSVLYLTNALHEFLHESGLVERPVHLIGTSMGGRITSMYSALYPQDVKQVTVICPAIYTPVKSKFAENYVAAGRNALLPETVEDMERLLEYVLYNKHKVIRNKQVLKGLLQLKQPNQQFYRELFSTLITTGTEEEDKKLFSQIKQPIQILWGEDDEVVHVSGAEYMRGLVADCRRVDIIKGCGHAMTFDSPALTAKNIVDFYNEMNK